MKDKENNAAENPETSTPPISDPEMANANNKNVPTTPQIWAATQI